MIINCAQCRNRQKRKRDELIVCNKEKSLHNGNNGLEENLERLV